ncbi:TIGR03086 family metal-binding protein [Streptomyces sp. NPDC054884]|uniref:TIGR03086 family metal-binding protein n=1 Tax=Streptomyces sp. ME08-AFT2 TaxID=3028683 RepID=UPI0029B9FF2C|nr:TIGR03086 family metal-binding protein [Streptomyces sp. ME08-AFT2]MDX3311404.1 TIGR03086 family metal-binding protein [Streptomyces sp. ME08-AFT2]
MKHDETHRYLSACAAEAARVARGVPAEGLNDPTHCPGWTLRTLVDHWVLYTSHGLEHRALRKPLPDELTGRDFTADPHWANAYAEQLDRAVTAWADPAVWEGEIDLGAAAMPAAEVVSLIIKETALHGWDVAVATGQEFRLPDDVARFVLDVVERHGDLYRRYEGFAQAVPVAQDAPVFERALAASGRDPRQGPVPAPA